MKKLSLLFGIILSFFFLLSGCTTTQPKTTSNPLVCNSPYILVGTSCCLDQNANNICDRDEVPMQTSPVNQSLPKPSIQSSSTLPIGTATFSSACQCGSQSAVDHEPGTKTTCKCAQITGCQGVADTTVRLKITEPTGVVKGTVILGTGTGGGSFYESFGQPAVNNIILPLLRNGFRVVQRSWFGSNGWLTGPGGPSKLACRYATLVDGVYKNIHTSGPMCVSGNSGGSVEIAYALTRYDMGRIIDLAVPTSGPPFGRLDYGCLGPIDPVWSSQCEGQFSCEFKGQALKLIDAAYGPASQDCQNRNPLMESTWYNDSVVSPFAQFNYPQTEMRFIFGDADHSEAVPLGKLYYDAITSSKKITTVSGGVPHTIPGVDTGAKQIFADLSEGCVLRH